MITLLTLISLLSVLPKCRTKECMNVPAGLNRMAMGVDITTLDLEPLDFTEPDGFAGRIIDFTCDEGKVWKHPYTGTTYQVPDQIGSIASVPGSWLNAETHVYRTKSDVIKKLSARVGIKAKSFFGSFSGSASYKSIRRMINEQSLCVTDVSSFVSTCQAVFSPAQVLGLNQDAMILYNFLPSQFEESPEPYYDFIKNYGTHFLFKGEFGGYISVMYLTDSTYYSSHTTRDIEANAKASFFGFLKSKGGYSDSVTTVDREFTQYSSTRIILHGGNTALLQTGDLPQWDSSVPQNPWMFAGSLIPIYNLFPNSTKRNSMERAVQAHLDKSFINDVFSTLEDASLKYKQTDTSLLRSVIEEGEALLDAVIPNHEQVIIFGERADHHFVIPDWWAETEICFKPRDATTSMGSCQESSGPFCAPSNAYTYRYIDYSYDSLRSCQMSWALFTPAYADNWFQKAEICFKFETTGDGRQCGNPDQPSVNCAPINSYTTEYLDATSPLHGGCQLSWMLKVSEHEAPFWFMKTKFCLSYTTGTNTGACGGTGNDNPLCASPNKWTKYYYDDTVKYGSSYRWGCQLKWGLFNFPY